MKLKLVLGLIAAGMLAGCASGPMEGGGEVDRAAVASEILADFEKTGVNEVGERVSIGPGFDQALNVTNSIARRQRDTIEDYRAQAENFVDIKRFEEIYGPLGSDSFMAGIEEFDADNPDSPMMPKVREYADAQSQVYAANTTLAAELVSAAAEVATLVSQNSDVVAEAAAAGALGGMMADDSDPNANLGAALVRAREQVAISQRASELIATEKETMEEILSLQADLEKQ
jgi:hypothetical protein